jgi:alpha-tubulin suppressor-like RCC1 family protein
MLKKIFIIGLSLIIIGSFCLAAKSCTNRNSSKTKSGSSNSGTFIINTPSNLIAIALSPSEISLSWQDNSNNEDGFEIWRSIDDSNFQLLTTVGLNVTSYSDANVSPITTYYYRVSAFNTIGDRSAYSNGISVNALASMSWSAIAAGGFHTLALTSDGSLWSWGTNAYFQLGLGITDTSDRPVPNRVGNEVGWRTIAAGGDYSFGIRTNSSGGTGGTLWGWGANAYGELGLGDDLDSSDPYPVGTDSDWFTVALGGRRDTDGPVHHTLALKTNGTLWAWGYNNYGQLGIGGTELFPGYWVCEDKNIPTQIGIASDWSQIAAGSYHTITLKTDGTLWVWGLNTNGQLGINDTSQRATPTQEFTTASDWSMIAAGSNHTIALKTNSTLWVWGYNDYGQLGDNTQTNRTTPRQIGTDSDWSIIDGGYNHTLGLKTSGTLWAWGLNNWGQLGLGNTQDRNSPAQAGTDSDWATISGGGNMFYGSYPTVYPTGFSLALKTNGTIWAWGYNSFGELGLGNTVNRTIPTRTGFPMSLSPSSLLAIPTSSSQINLTWSDNSSNEIGFKIERSVSTNTNYTLLATFGADITSYSDNGLSCDIRYYYRVQAYNNYGNSFSNIASATPTVFAPSILNLQVISSTRVDLSWQDNAIDETGFKIERSINTNTDYTLLATFGANVTSYSDTAGFVPGTTYYYRVWSYNSFGNSLYSNEANVTIIGSPSSLNATVISSSQINISWTDTADNETGFKIERSVSTNTNYTLLATVGADITSYSDTAGFAPGTTYYYRVRAYNSFGNSLYSNEANVIITGSPSSLNATVISSSQLNIYWADTADNETGFKIERKIGILDTYEQISTVEANITSYFDSDINLTLVTTYYYRVRAYNSYGDSLYSNEVNVLRAIDPNIDIGNGADGAITITATTNMNTTPIATGRTKPDAITFVVTGTVNTGNTNVILTTAPDVPNELTSGDEVIIINLKGTSVTYTNTGLYEFKRIQSITGDTITFTSAISNTYGDAASGQKIILQRVPNYTNVTINSGISLTISSWNGITGGVLAFRANGAVTVNALNGIDVIGKGFRGGAGTSYWQKANGGESYNGIGGTGGRGDGYDDSGNSGQGGGGGGGGDGMGAVGAAGSGGGGGGGVSYDVSSVRGGGGGGGGYGSAGSGGSGGGGAFNGVSGGNPNGGAGGRSPGSNYGGGGGGGGGIVGNSATLNQQVYMGGGGAAGGGGEPYSSAKGGNGGGIIFIAVEVLSVISGASIAASGENAGIPSSDSSRCPGGSGGGAGGSIILLIYQQLTNFGNINANGGNASSVSGGRAGGAGGGGRTYARYVSFTGNVPIPIPTPFAPMAPTNLNLTVISSTKINLSWADNSNNETGFKIERKTGSDGTWGQIATVGSNVISYSDRNGLTPETIYYYKVRAYNANGDSTYSPETSATTFPASWLMVAAGAWHTIALKTAGTLWSWGYNGEGELGLGVSGDINTPSQVGTQSDWSSFSAGSWHTLVLKTDRTIWSWGRNNYGQLGLGFTTDGATGIFTPTQIGTDSDWSVVAAGSDDGSSWYFGSGHSLAIRTNGTLWSWGLNDNGQLGLGDYTKRTTPSRIGTQSDWSAVAAGAYYTIALKTTGTLWSWGYNDYGQLGLNDTGINRNTPTQIGTQSDWFNISAGCWHTIGVKTNKTLWAWGMNYGLLGLGNSDYDDRVTPTLVGTESDWAVAMAGQIHTVGLKTNGTIWSWGDSSYGQLGLGDIVWTTTPTQIGMETDWSAIGVSSYYQTFGLKTNRTIWAWGANGSSQLGLGDTINRNTPTMVGE